jgi:hypothetical protein
MRTIGGAEGLFRTKKDVKVAWDLKQKEETALSLLLQKEREKKSSGKSDSDSTLSALLTKGRRKEHAADIQERINKIRM